MDQGNWKISDKIAFIITSLFHLQVRSMLSRRCRLGVATLNGKLYACGGSFAVGLLQRNKNIRFAFFLQDTMVAVSYDRLKFTLQKTISGS